MRSPLNSIVGARSAMASPLIETAVQLVLVSAAVGAFDAHAAANNALMIEVATMAARVERTRFTSTTTSGGGNLFLRPWRFWRRKGHVAGFDIAVDLGGQRMDFALRPRQPLQRCEVARRDIGLDPLPDAAAKLARRALRFARHREITHSVGGIGRGWRIAGGQRQQRTKCKQTHHASGCQMSCVRYQVSALV